MYFALIKQSIRQIKQSLDVHYKTICAEFPHSPKCNSLNMLDSINMLNHFSMLDVP